MDVSEARRQVRSGGGRVHQRSGHFPSAISVSFLFADRCSTWRFGTSSRWVVIFVLCAVSGGGGRRYHSRGTRLQVATWFRGQVARDWDFSGREQNDSRGGRTKWLLEVVCTCLTLRKALAELHALLELWSTYDNSSDFSTVIWPLYRYYCGTQHTRFRIRVTLHARGSFHPRQRRQEHLGRSLRMVAGRGCASLIGLEVLEVVQR